MRTEENLLELNNILSNLTTEQLERLYDGKIQTRTLSKKEKEKKEQE